MRLYTRETQKYILLRRAKATTATARTHNQYGEAETFDAKIGGASLFGVTYTRDTIGRISTKTETIAGATVTFACTYDLAGRLTTVTKNGAAEGR